MTSRTRLLVLMISTPLLAFVLVGGILGARATTSEPTLERTLRVFDDVISLIRYNYVEEVDEDEVMEGAMRGLADGLDPESAYLLPEAVRAVESGDELPEGQTGIDLTRQYYLRVVSVRDGSPAERAGLRSGDFIRAINGKPTRDMSVFEGTRLLRGQPGSTVSLLVIRGNAADPHVVDLVREKSSAPAVSARLVNGTIGYLRVPAFSAHTAESLKTRIAELARDGAGRLLIDLRDASEGALDYGVAAASLFLRDGATIAVRTTRSGEKTPVTATAQGDIKLPVVLLVNGGTAGPAEIFAAALSGNGRAQVVGEQTTGRTGLQKLVKLPQGHGLWLTYATFTTPAGDVIHEKGLEPDTAVEEPDVEFGTVPDPAAKDPIFDKGVEVLAAPRAAAN